MLPYSPTCGFMAASYTPNAAYSSESVPFRPADASYAYDGSQASPREQFSPAPRQGPAVAFDPVSVSNVWPLVRKVTFVWI